MGLSGVGWDSNEKHKPIFSGLALEQPRQRHPRRQEHSINCQPYGQHDQRSKHATTFYPEKVSHRRIESLTVLRCNLDLPSSIALVKKYGLARLASSRRGRSNADDGHLLPPAAAVQEVVCAWKLMRA